jgi:hypothetical protein
MTGDMNLLKSKRLMYFLLVLAILILIYSNSVHATSLDGTNQTISFEESLSNDPKIAKIDEKDIEGIPTKKIVKTNSKENIKESHELQDISL